MNSLVFSVFLHAAVSHVLVDPRDLSVFVQTLSGDHCDAVLVVSSGANGFWSFFFSFAAADKGTRTFTDNS